MHITIVAVGRLKENYLEAAVAEYLKRLTPYARLKIREVKDEPCPDQGSLSDQEAAKAREAARIEKVLQQLPGAGAASYRIVLDVAGTEMTSEGFARYLQQLGLEGKSDLIFIIGGAAGLAPEILQAADLRLSFSRMTFPHQLMRVILLEQIYRAFKIIKGEPYHR